MNYIACVAGGFGGGLGFRGTSGEAARRMVTKEREKPPPARIHGSFYLSVH